MDLIDGHVRLNIELKGNQTALLTNELLQYYFEREESGWSPEKVFISSFDLPNLYMKFSISKKVFLVSLTKSSYLTNK